MYLYIIVRTIKFCIDYGAARLRLLLASPPAHGSRVFPAEALEAGAIAICARPRFLPRLGTDVVLHAMASIARALFQTPPCGSKPASHDRTLLSAVYSNKCAHPALNTLT